MKKFTLSSLLTLTVCMSFAQWTNTGCPTGTTTIYDMLVSDNKLLAAGTKGVFVTTDGTTWNTSHTGIAVTGGYTFTQSLKSFDGTLYAGTNGSQLYTSTDHGQNWTGLTGRSGLVTVKVSSIYKNSSVLIYGTDGNGGSHFSTNGGTSWSGSEYPFGSTINNTVCKDIVELDNVLYSSSLKNVFKSTDNGDTWVEITTAPAIAGTTTSLCTINGGLLLSIYGDGVYRSLDAGTTWTKVLGGALGTPSNNMTRVYYESGVALAGGALQQVYISTDNGATWTDITETGMAAGDVLQSFKIFDGYIYAGTNTAVYRKSFSVNITEINQASSFVIYPNPAQNFVMVEGVETGTTMNIFDLTGKQVKSVVIDLSGRVELGDLQKGCYFISNGTSSKKIIIR